MADPIRKIAVDLTPVLPGGENGGSKVFSLDLIRRLSKLKPDVEFVLLTHQNSHAELAYLDGKNVRRELLSGFPENGRAFGHKLSALLARSFKAFGLPSRGTAEQLLRKLRPDLLFHPFTRQFDFDPRVPTVCTIYDLQHRSYPDFFSRDQIAQRESAFAEACRTVTLISTISDYSRDEIIREGNLSESRIRTIHLGLTRHAVSSGQASVPERWGLKPMKYLIYPANFWQHKNHERLFAALQIARGKGLPADMKLVCTGADSPRKGALRSIVESLGLSQTVVFPGFVAVSELSELIHHSLALVFPSLFEGFGMPPIEAMAAGVPVACSNVTSLPEIVGDAALMFDPREPQQISDAMIEICANEALRNRLVRDGRLRVDRLFDADRVSIDYWNLFEDAVRIGRHAPG